MPVTNKNFIIANYDEIEKIFTQNNINKCLLGHFSDTGLQIMLDTNNSKDFSQTKKALQKLAVDKKAAFTLTFCTFSASGQAMSLPIDSVDFFSLNEDDKSLLVDTTTKLPDNIKTPDSGQLKANPFPFFSKPLMQSTISDIHTVYKQDEAHAVYVQLFELAQFMEKIKEKTTFLVSSDSLSHLHNPLLEQHVIKIIQGISNLAEPLLGLEKVLQSSEIALASSSNGSKLI